MSTDLINKSITLPCGVTLKNRIAKSAMSENMATQEHRANTKFEQLYQRWANGGASLLMTGNVMIDKDALGEPNNVVVESGRDYQDLVAWAKAGTENNTNLWIQINHPGKQSPKFLSSAPVAPSAIPLRAPLNKTFNTPRELSEPEIHTIIDKFAFVAKTAKNCGFTGVQIHGAHGYLVSQFLSPHHNQRNDQWGGSLQNRMRFVLEIYDRIRAAVGEKFPVGIKLNSADFQRGGFSQEESMEVVQTLSKRGMDLIEISGGSYEAPRMMGAQQSTSEREAYFLDYCLEVRKHVHTPLMLTGGFRSLHGMHAALSAGACDVIGLGRSIVINPNFPNELLLGKDTKSSVHKITTGIQALDKMFPLEIVWYTNQIHRMGKSLNPKPNQHAAVSILQSLVGMGLHSLKRVRAKG